MKTQRFREQTPEERSKFEFVNEKSEFNINTHQEEEVKEPPQPAFDKTSILLTRSHSDSNGSPECSYCGGKRNTYNGEEKDLKYHKTGFTTNKFKVSDYEVLL